LATGRPASGRPMPETVATELYELAEGHSQRAAWECPRPGRRNTAPAGAFAPSASEPLRIAACRQPFGNSPASSSASRPGAGCTGWLAPLGRSDEWHLDLEKTVTLEQLGSCPSCPVSRKKPDLRAIRRSDRSAEPA